MWGLPDFDARWVQFERVNPSRLASLPASENDKQALRREMESRLSPTRSSDGLFDAAVIRMAAKEKEGWPVRERPPALETHRRTFDHLGRYYRLSVENVEK